MTPDERERMAILCERIAMEQDASALRRLIRELNELLGRKLQRLEDKSGSHCAVRRARLLRDHRFHQVSRMVYVISLVDGDVVGE
jgi:hypothetical protein